MFDIAFLDLPPLEAAHGTVQLPGSKSISNRVLLLAALSEGATLVHDLLDSDDTRVMLDALRALGCSVVHEGTAVRISPSPSGGGPGWGHSVPVAASGGAPSPTLPQGGREQGTRLFLGNAGTAMRPLTAALALAGGTFELS